MISLSNNNDHKNTPCATEISEGVGDHNPNHKETHEWSPFSPFLPGARNPANGAPCLGVVDDDAGADSAQPLPPACEDATAAATSACATRCFWWYAVAYAICWYAAGLRKLAKPGDTAECRGELCEFRVPGAAWGWL